MAQLDLNRQTDIPGTTKGDLVVHDGSDYVRLGVGTDGFVLKAASGQPSGLQWAAEVAPGGSTTQVQFNAAGAFDGDAAFIWDDTAKHLGVGPTTADERLHVSEAVDGAFIGALLENSQAADAGTNETVALAFGFGGVNDAAQIVVVKDNDFQSAGNEDAGLEFWVLSSSTPTKALKINTDGDLFGQIAGQYLELIEGAAPGNPAAGRLRLFMDSGTSELSVRTSGGTTVSLQAGEANTASNIGTAGVGLFDAKVGADLQFRKLNAGSSKVTITDDPGNNEVDVDVVEANLTLDNLGGTLGIAKGGTGQTTATPAFDALAPTTTKGDVIAHNGSDNIRLAIGTDGQLLAADSAEVSGVKWVNAPSGTVPIGTQGQKLGYGASGVLAARDWIVLAEDYGAVGDGASDDTTPLQNAINAVKNTGKTLWLQKTYKTTAALVVDGSIILDGGGTIALTAASGTHNILEWNQQAAGTITGFNETTTRLSRATSVLNNVDVDSAVGFTVGDYVRLEWTDGSFIFRQTSRLRSIVTDTLTFDDPVMIPVNATHASTVIEVNQYSGVTVRNLTLDGSNASAATTVRGILAQGINNGLFENLRILDCKTSGLGGSQFYDVAFRGISVERCGSAGESDFQVTDTSNCSFHDIRSLNSTGFGPQWVHAVNCVGSNIKSSGAQAGRALKFQGCGWNEWSNLTADKSSSTGLSISDGSWQNRFTNVHAHDNLNDTGIWFSDQENIYNVIDGVSAYGNLTQDINMPSADIRNVVKNAEFENITWADLTGQSGSIINNAQVGTLIYDPINVPVSNTVVETNLKTFTVKANTAPYRRLYRVRLYGVYNTANGTDTLTIRCKQATTALHTSVSTARFSANQGLYVEWLVGLQAAPGASASAETREPHCFLDNVQKADHVTSLWTWDTTADLTFSITVQWSNALAGNILSATMFTVEAVN
jgi:hypothetical protein